MIHIILYITLVANIIVWGALISVFAYVTLKNKVKGRSCKLKKNDNKKTSILSVHDPKGV